MIDSVTSVDGALLLCLMQAGPCSNGRHDMRLDQESSFHYCFKCSECHAHVHVGKDGKVFV